MGGKNYSGVWIMILVIVILSFAGGVITTMARYDSRCEMARKVAAKIRNEPGSHPIINSASADLIELTADYIQGKKDSM